MRPAIGWLALGLLLADVASAQTTAATGTSIVFPVAAQTVSFASEMTLFNPGPTLLTATVHFYEANNSAAPGPKICNDAAIPAGRSVQLTLATQCALAAGGHFGLVVVADKTVPATHAFYGYMRVQNPQGLGFSVEGFPVSNFNNQVGNATGLKRKAAAPAYQTNCFVGSLDQPVGYQLKLFNDSTGAQVGGTLTGSLTAFQQHRYLDVFGIDGVNAAAGDLSNVRAEFTQTSGGSANLIGFCTVQDNASFGADFRIAKSYGSPSGSFFAQGGNAFGATAHLGTNDNHPLEFYANGQRVMRYAPDPTSPNLIGGRPANSAGAFSGQTVAGGGAAGNTCFDSVVRSYIRPCANQSTGAFATVSGGESNVAAASATVAGGVSNTANGSFATIGGGYAQVATSPYATVGGGNENHAGDYATAAGGSFNSANDKATVGGGYSNYADGVAATIGGGDSNDASASLATVGGGSGNLVGAGINATGVPTSVCYTQNLTGWSCTSDRNVKRNLRALDTENVLAKVVGMPVYHWQPKDGPNRDVEHLGPMAQDFKAAFGLGDSDKAIGFQDADGVALAAIQGMHRLMQQKDAQIQAPEQRVASMQRQMALVESMQQRIAPLEAVHDEVAELKATLNPRGVTAPLRPSGLPSRSDSRAAN